MKYNQLLLKTLTPALLAIATILLLNSCQRSPLKVDISNIKTEITIDRLDHDLFAVTPENEAKQVAILQAKYGELFDAYNQEVIAIGLPSDSLYFFYLQSFLTDSAILGAKEAVDLTFPNLKTLEKQLGQAFGYYHYHFPEKEIPRVYTFVSGFNQSAIMLPNALGISLDNYLGADNPLYAQLALPEYKRQTMFPEKIAYDALFAWGMSEFGRKIEDENLLANLIYYGKLLYFLDAMFPDSNDELKIGYTAEKLEWCHQHENAMWTYIVENRLLYQNDRMTTLRFINPAPFTSVFTNESPGRAGIWIGWQIVRKYMKKNPTVTLSELMDDNDYQKIMNGSAYSPK